MNAISGTPLGFAIVQAFGAEAERLARSAVEVRVNGAGAGSGVIWREDMIITNAHVAREPKARIELHDGRLIDAHVVRRDRRRDLAALAVSEPGLEPAPIGNADTLRPGQFVFALGTPFGIPRAVSAGIVHAVGGRWVQADLRLAPGNSGGPLADAMGRVIGINSMIMGGLALAIPSDAVERFLAPAAMTSEPRPVLGIRIRPVVMGRNVSREPGLLVLEVLPGSLAERSGVLQGDTLVGVDAVPFVRINDLNVWLRRSASGATLRLRLLRGGVSMELTVILSPFAEALPT